jgi:hypothetical protein
MERQMEEDSKSVNVESCEEDLRCKCIWGYIDSYDDSKSEFCSLKTNTG